MFLKSTSEYYGMRWLKKKSSFFGLLPLGAIFPELCDVLGHGVVVIAEIMSLGLL